MNIQILDSWLREHLKTKATPKVISEKLSLSSVSVERLAKMGDDYLYDIEVTTNRPDLMSVVGLAREAAAVLSQNNIQAKFIPINLSHPKVAVSETINIKDNSNIVNRVCAVVMDVNIKKSPEYIHERLEATGIRSLNNLIDITNYVMRTIGHPTHVFDFDRIPTKTIEIRESRPKEKIITLDGKTYTLRGGDIVADDGLGHIIDLLGVIGLKNSVTNDTTKRILFFIDNNDPHKIRKTSMTHGIRTEAAVLNEKEIDPELAMDALLYGIKLFEKLADGKVISKITDIYPNKSQNIKIVVEENHINSLVGVKIPLSNSCEILEKLGFDVERHSNRLIVKPPSFRRSDILIAVDVIEEIARVYGYENIPNRIPSITEQQPFNFSKNQFYFEDRAKNALKYWGFSEVYTYPMVSKNLYEGDLESSVKIKNPLNEDFEYMRISLVPSLLKVVRENKTHQEIRIFEIANIYKKNASGLPKQILKASGIIKKKTTSFYEVKGIIEQLLNDLGISNLVFKQSHAGSGATIFIKDESIGDIEILDENTIDFELNFEIVLRHATIKKIYKVVGKFPPIMEDLTIIASDQVSTGEIIDEIINQSSLIKDVALTDKYQDTRTFHVVYQSSERNLKNIEISLIRVKILKVLKEKLGAELK